MHPSPGSGGFSTPFFHINYITEFDLHQTTNRPEHWPSIIKTFQERQIVFRPWLSSCAPWLILGACDWISLLWRLKHLSLSPLRHVRSSICSVFCWNGYGATALGFTDGFCISVRDWKTCRSNSKARGQERIRFRNSAAYCISPLSPVFWVVTLSLYRYTIIHAHDSETL